MKGHFEGGTLHINRMSETSLNFKIARVVGKLRLSVQRLNVVRMLSLKLSSIFLFLESKCAEIA